MSMENGNVDYTQPLATLLKVATTVAHERAEHSQGAGWLTRGELDKEEYIRFLMMLYHVYDALEEGLEKYSAHPVLAPTYNPTLLSRAPSIAADIAFLLDVSEDAWEFHPLHQALVTSPPQAFREYVGRIKHLTDEAGDPAPLLAHSYVRYLGDLSGGQTIRRSIAKAYAADEDEKDGRGTQFYAFSRLGGGGPATAGDMRRIKDWFRAGMNTGGDNDSTRKQAIAEEAVYAFDLNMGLFTLLRPPSNPKSASSQEPAEAPLGNPDSSLPPTPPPEAEANGYSSVNEKSKSDSTYYQRWESSSRAAPAGEVKTSQKVLFGLVVFGVVMSGIGGWKWVGERLASILG